MFYFFRDRPKSKNKGDTNYPSEPKISKFLTPVGKGNGNSYPTFDADKESPSN